MREQYDPNPGRWALLSLLAALVLGALQVTRAQTPPPVVVATDARVQAEAIDYDWPPELDEVQARRRGGLVVLEGRVAREADRALAEQVARADPLTREVLNRIEVDATVGERLSAALDAAARRVVRWIGQVPLLLLALLLAWTAWRAGRWVARRSWLERAAHNPFAVELLRQAVRLAVFALGLLVALQLLDATALATALLGSAGVVGIALGFAFRDLLENYIAGVLLSLRQPFAPDDLVRVDGHEGVVVGMNSRATLLMTSDGNHLTLPNALVFKAVVLNFTRNRRRRFHFTLPADAAASASSALDAVLQAVRDTPGVLREPAPFVELAEWTAEELRVGAYGWVDQGAQSWSGVRSEALRQARRALRRAGLEVAPRALRLLSGEAAPAAAAGGEPALAAAVRETTEHEAIQGAVEQTRAEMGSSNLMQGNARE